MIFTKNQAFFPSGRRIPERIPGKIPGKIPGRIIGKAEGIRRHEIRTCFKEKARAFPRKTNPKRLWYKQFAYKEIPRHCLFDRDGKLLYQQVGYSLQNTKNLLDLLQKCLM